MSLSKYFYLPYSQVLITVALIMYMKLLYLRADGGTRTHTGVSPHVPQTCLSTSSSTPAKYPDSPGGHRFAFLISCAGATVGPAQ